MNSVKQLNDIMEQSRLKKKEAGLNTKTIRLKQSQWEAGKSNKGRKHSEETKKKWSEAHKGKKLSIEHIEKVATKGKQTKWLQLLEKYPLQIILNAQLNNGNHQTNTCKELGIRFYSYKKLCKHYDIELKKSNYDKTEFARSEQSKAIIAYEYNKLKSNGKGKKIAEYYSIAEASRKLEIPKCRGHIIAVLQKKRPHTNNYYFEYKK